jgi:hypothetical protein
MASSPIVIDTNKDEPKGRMGMVKINYLKPSIK